MRAHRETNMYIKKERKKDENRQQTTDKAKQIEKVNPIKEKNTKMELWSIEKLEYTQ